jgi:hypothetical protein
MSEEREFNSRPRLDRSLLQSIQAASWDHLSSYSLGNILFDWSKAAGVWSSLHLHVFYGAIFPLPNTALLAWSSIKHRGSFQSQYSPQHSGCCSLGVTDQVQGPCKTAGKINFVHLIIINLIADGSKTQTGKKIIRTWTAGNRIKYIVRSDVRMTVC